MKRRLRDDVRPATHFDPAVQHERTALAWERTAISMMVAGVLLARYAASESHFVVALAGLAWVATGGVVLVWTGYRYEALHGPLREGQSPVHPRAVRFVGVSTVAFTGLGLVLAAIFILVDGF